MDHVFYRSKSVFSKNKEDYSPPPSRLNGDDIWDCVSSLPKASDHQDKVAGYGEFHNWSRTSILWALPYQRRLLIQHNLDVMHIEKNIFEQIINTIMNAKGKSKAGRTLPHIVSAEDFMCRQLMLVMEIEER